LLHGLRLAISLGIKRLLVYGDSLLVVQQVNKEWDYNKETMDTYVQEVHKLENKFSSLEVHHVVREHNVGAHILSKLGSTRAQVPARVFIQELKQPYIKSSSQVTTDAGLQKPEREVMMLGEDWREAYIDFIRDQRLPTGMDARSTGVGELLKVLDQQRRVGEARTGSSHDGGEVAAGRCSGRGGVTWSARKKAKGEELGRRSA
jgi:hypothetical protein